MSFVDPAFLFLFIPITVAIYYALVLTKQSKFLIPFLICASLVFYSYWNIVYTLYLVIFILINYFLGITTTKIDKYQKFSFIVAIAINLIILGYFKYYIFFLSNISAILGGDRDLINIILPLGISFVTFQVIAWHTDLFKRRAELPSFTSFALFVMFFPQLIAGPIVHYSDVINQYVRLYARSRVRWRTDLAIGISIFSIGLFKKTMLADSLAVYAQSTFDGFAEGQASDMVSTQIAMLAYSFQLYFDFSGYSDMAIGLARMFGVRFPINFLSPYKALSITDFWRRWHMTLSRFLRDHLYIPLGGNRLGKSRQRLNILVTMLLGGLWHGANWTFVVWGGLHGIFLVVAHQWHALVTPRVKGRLIRRGSIYIAWFSTFILVTITWVFFRAENLTVAFDMLGVASGLSEGLSYHPDLSRDFPAAASFLNMVGASVADATNPNMMTPFALFGIVFSLFIVLFLPNTAALFRYYRPTTNYADVLTKERNTIGFKIAFRLSPIWGLYVSGLLFISFLRVFQQRSDAIFIYFQF